MLCPHCLKEVHVAEQMSVADRPEPVVMVVPEYRRGDPYYHLFRAAFCPACYKPIILHDFAGLPVNLETLMNRNINAFGEVVFPAKPALRPLPQEVPAEYRQDFDESRLVVDFSPKSSAALSRRLLQRILHERFNINRPNLQQEIQEFISLLGPPTHLAQQLDAVRLVGNFAAHPMKVTNTGGITDVEDGEAELLITTLESLFDFAFVQPAKWAAAKSALNAKLRAAGKPELP